MTRSSSRVCNSAAISAIAWRSLPAGRRPIGLSIIRRKPWQQATRFGSPPQRRRSPRPHRNRKRHSNEARSMRVCTTFPPQARDLRLDLFRGLANWAIFLDHIPHEVLSSITTRNYGFSDAADLFVFISGYAAALVFGRVMIERGYLAAASRLVKRALQLYAAHIVVVVVYIAIIVSVARCLHDPNDLNVFNVAVFISKPLWESIQALALGYRPVNLDVLPLYILLLATFAPVLWLMVRKVGSMVVYLAGRHFGWNLPTSPSGSWYFNPFAWQ